jgi:teichuronic acid biosynthesis glycosyltransferase TuaG
MTGHTVSIIMPAYNAEKYISESIDSVIAQTYSNWELIVIDDGSTDGTAEIVKKKQKEDGRIFYYYQENGRQGKARNKGLKESRSEFIAFLDADDLWSPNKLELQVECLNNHKADLIFSDGYIIQNDRDDIQFSFQTITGYFQGDKAIELFLIQNRIPILSVLTTKQAIIEAGCFEEDVRIQNIEDYHLWLKMLIKGFSVFGLPEKLVYYRQHIMQATYKDPLSSEKVFYMLDTINNLSPRLDPVLNNARLIWARNWYDYNAKNRKTALEILRRMSFRPQLKNISLLTKIALIFFGVRLSIMAMNKLICFKISIKSC